MQQPIPFDYLLSDYLERGSYKPGDIIRYRERISRTPRHILTGLTYRTKTPIPGSAAQYLMRVEHTPGDRFGNDCRISRIHTIKINRYFTCDKSRDYRKDGLYISIFSVLIPYQPKKFWFCVSVLLFTISSQTGSYRHYKLALAPIYKNCVHISFHG